MSAAARLAAADRMRGGVSSQAFQSAAIRHIRLIRVPIVPSSTRQDWLGTRQHYARITADNADGRGLFVGRFAGFRAFVGSTVPTQLAESAWNSSGTRKRAKKREK